MKKEIKICMSPYKIVYSVLFLLLFSLAMGVAVVVLSILNEMESDSAVRMLGIGLACLAVAQLAQKKDGRE